MFTLVVGKKMSLMAKEYIFIKMGRSMKVLLETEKWKVEVSTITMRAVPIMRATGKMDRNMVKVSILVKKKSMMVNGNTAKEVEMVLTRAKY